MLSQTVLPPERQPSLPSLLLGTPFAKQLQTFPHMSEEILPVAFWANFPSVLRKKLT